MMDTSFALPFAKFSKVTQFLKDIGRRLFLDEKNGQTLSLTNIGGRSTGIFTPALPDHDHFNHKLDNSRYFGGKTNLTNGLSRIYYERRFLRNNALPVTILITSPVDCLKAVDKELLSALREKNRRILSVAIGNLPINFEKIFNFHNFEIIQIPHWDHLSDLKYIYQVANYLRSVV